MSAGPRLPDTVPSLPAAVAFWAEHAPAAPAIVMPGQLSVTYAELWVRVRAVASTLAAAGTSREDRVVLVLPEGAAQIAALVGTMLAGVAVPLPVSLTAVELDRALHGLRAAMAIVAPNTAPDARACFARHGVAVLELGEPAPRETSITSHSWPRAEELAIVRQTSGATGRPKRIPSPHGHLVDHGRRHRDLLGVGRGDRVPAVTPLTVTLGQAVLSHAIVAGAALIVPPQTGFSAAWEAIARAQPTWISTSAGYLELLARLLADAPHFPAIPSLRFVQVTAAPLSLEVARILDRALGVPILPRYSSTEAGAIAMTFPPPARAKPGSVGQPVLDVRFVDPDGADVSSGSEGEIWVRGPRVMSGYLDDPEATAAALLPDGWYRTGDLGYLDADGFLFLTGRVNELINRGGEKIAPAQVDEALQAHPAVLEAAAFAVPDARLGEDIFAAVVLREGRAVRARELRAWMLDRLSPANVPRRFWLVDELPRTATGKVQRGVLARRFGERGREGT